VGVTLFSAEARLSCFVTDKSMLRLFELTKAGGCVIKKRLKTIRYEFEVFGTFSQTYCKL
jgi:hypothetical protein